MLLLPLLALDEPLYLPLALQHRSVSCLDTYIIKHRRDLDTDTLHWRSSMGDAGHEACALAANASMHCHCAMPQCSFSCRDVLPANAIKLNSSGPTHMEAAHVLSLFPSQCVPVKDPPHRKGSLT